MAGVNFTNASVVGASFSWSAYQCCFSYTGGANLVNAIFAGANLSGVQFSNATVANADFTGANLSGSNSYACFPNWPYWCLGANFQNSNFTNAVLTSSNFSASNVLGATYWQTTCPDGTLSQDNFGTCAGRGGGL